VKACRLSRNGVSLQIISVPLAAKQLGVSQQAATTMIEELSPNLREQTERRRYRAWAASEP
jgi:hypothetical protein